MTVATYNPTKNIPVEFTSKAVKHLVRQVESKDAMGVEFKVKEAGCSGYKYLLELAFEVSDESLEFPISDELKLFTEPKVIPLIQGTIIDYVQEGVNFKLTFENPNATASCGCGESFSVTPQ